jgi:hypothetical protein
MNVKRLVGMIVVYLAFAVFAPNALGQVPAWSVTTGAAPTNLPPGGKGIILAAVTNLGDADAEGSVDPIVIHDALPPGLTATGISGRVDYQAGSGEVKCTLATLTCEYSETLPPYSILHTQIEVSVDPGAASGGLNHVKVSGGAAAPVSSEDPVPVSATPAKFGVERLRLVPENEDGSPDTQAGSHPFQLTTTLELNRNAFNSEPIHDPVAYEKDLHFLTPPGLIGDPQAVPQCTGKQFSEFNPVLGINGCPADTAVGVATVIVSFGIDYTVPLFNLVPSVGEPARFGFEAVRVPVILDTSVRTGGDYGVTVSVDNISQITPLAGSQVTFWGVPGDPRHDNSRGWDCLLNGDTPVSQVGPCETPGEHQLTPFLTLPTSCEGPLRTTLLADSWSEPNNSAFGEYVMHDNQGDPLGMSGCEKLDFQPSISVTPDGQAGSTPTGLTVGLHVPQHASLSPTGLSEADVRDTTVALPAGVALNPAAADGLMACSLAQIDLEHGNASLCPEAAKVGTVKIDTPLLPEPLEGYAYLATQDANPFGSLVALYIVAQDPTAGVVVKFAGQVTPDPVTGQLVSTFKNTPQLPFEDLHLKFFGGDRAPLATPAKCGSYTTSASLTPWSSSGPSVSASSFDIASGPNGTPCADPLPFAPSLTAGTTNIQAGGFTPFTMTMSREDGSQTLQAIQLHMPPGLLGMLSSVKLCEEPQASQGACGPESLIGHTIVSVGLGGDPFTVTGGQVFITGSYKGAPYGLSIVNPAKAGPFDLGQVIVRAAIDVDPTTSALTITSDALPTILDGIPLEIRHVNVSIDRPNFTFNPTSCDRMAVTGRLSSSEGAGVSLSTPFQVTTCAALSFHPKFSVTTSGKTSKANGASLDAKLVESGAGGQPVLATNGGQANIARVKVELPKALPSRLTTLQKACTAQVFEANPAACPAASRIGYARATTPILPVQLTGPAYFVSHGGEAFPSLIVVLQGYGVRVDLVGATFISRQGITSSTFGAVPDVPVSSFELYLPEGPYSALAANGNLCQKQLKMPTEMVAQNGTIIHQSTTVGVTGCKKPKTKTKAKAKAKARRSRKASKGRQAASANAVTDRRHS